jgi:hypothetical protein
MTVAGRSLGHEPAAHGTTSSQLPERPPISSPHGRGQATPDAESPGIPTQPRLGLVGLVLVIPIAAALALGADGAEASVLILGPLVTYSLPLIAMVAFWWEDWPGTRLRASWSGWVDTAIVAIGAIVLTGIGQTLAGGLDLPGMFDPSPGPGHVPTFPATLPLAAAAFTAMLELTLVGEGWPLRRLPRLPAGLLALGTAWALALVVYLTLVDVRPLPGSGVTPRRGPVSGDDLGAALVLIGAWQVLFYVVWRGWPFSTISRRSLRLGCAHVVVIGGGVLTYLVAHDVMADGSGRLAAVAGCFVAAGLLLGMQFEGWLQPHLGSGAERLVTLLAALALAGILATALRGLTGAMHFERATADEWVAHTSLAAIGVSTILHVAIGRRWPFASPATADETTT